jgi:uncharacterized protein YcnI
VLTKVTTALLAGAAMLSATVPASAHVKVYVEPGWTQAPACGFSEFIVQVPNERPDPTIRIELDVPPAVTVSTAQPVPGWTTAFTTTKGRITGITWSGQLNPREFQTFAFLAGTPQTPGTLSWNAHQTYQNGEIVNWTGAPGSDTPHSQTIITRAAQPSDCHPRRRT